jgi:lysozyme
VTPAYIARLKAKEGTVKRKGRHMPYTDSVGKLTIGWGRNLTDRGLSDEEAELLLTNDVAEHWGETRGAFPWLERLHPVRQEVVQEMAFNMGVPTLRGFRRTLAAMAADQDVAADYMLESLWARQVGKRATELSRMWRTKERL